VTLFNLRPSAGSPPPSKNGQLHPCAHNWVESARYPAMFRCEHCGAFTTKKA